VQSLGEVFGERATAHRFEFVEAGLVMGDGNDEEGLRGMGLYEVEERIGRKLVDRRDGC
jgi:hypothetical protein